MFIYDSDPYKKYYKDEKMKCLNCGEEMYWSGDHDEEECSEYLICSNYSCPNCESVMLFYTKRDERPS